MLNFASLSTSDTLIPIMDLFLRLSGSEDKEEVSKYNVVP